MSKENFKQLIKLLIRPFVLISSLFILGLLISLVPHVIIEWDKYAIKSSIKYSKFELTSFKARVPGSDDLLFNSAFLMFYNNSFDLLIDSLRVKGEYRIIDIGKIVFLNCDTLHGIVCQEFYISISDKGLWLISADYKIDGVKIRK